MFSLGLVLAGCFVVWFVVVDRGWVWLLCFVAGLVTDFVVVDRGWVWLLCFVAGLVTDFVSSILGVKFSVQFSGSILFRVLLVQFWWRVLQFNFGGEFQVQF